MHLDEPFPSAVEVGVVVVVEAGLLLSCSVPKGMEASTARHPEIPVFADTLCYSTLIT